MKIKVQVNNTPDTSVHISAALYSRENDIPLYLIIGKKDSGRCLLNISCGTVFTILPDGKRATNWKSARPKAIKVSKSGKVQVLYDENKSAKLSCESADCKFYVKINAENSPVIWYHSARYIDSKPTIQRTIVNELTKT